MVAAAVVVARDVVARVVAAHAVVGARSNSRLSTFVVHRKMIVAVERFFCSP